MSSGRGLSLRGRRLEREALGSSYAFEGISLFVTAAKALAELCQGKHEDDDLRRMSLG